MIFAQKILRRNRQILQSQSILEKANTENHSSDHKTTITELQERALTKNSELDEFI